METDEGFHQAKENQNHRKKKYDDLIIFKDASDQATSLLQAVTCV